VFKELKGKWEHPKCLANPELFIKKNGVDKIVYQLHYEDEFREKFCTDIQEDTDNDIKKVDEILHNLESSNCFESDDSSNNLSSE